MPVTGLKGRFIFVLFLHSNYDDPAGRHLGRGGLTNPPQKEQCRKAVRTELRTGPGVQRPKSPYNQSLSDYSNLTKVTVITVIKGILITVITPYIK